MKKIPRTVVAVSFLVALLTPLGLLAQASAGALGGQQIVVVDDSGQGVASIVYRNAVKDDSILGDTDAAGSLNLEPACSSGVLLADPKVGSHTRGRANCAPRESRIEIRVTRHDYLRNLRQNAKLLEEREEFGKAAFVNNELWFREGAAGNGAEARVARLKVYELLAQHFELSGKEAILIDPEQDILVMSPKLRSYVAEYQAAEGLRDQTGIVDYKTLSRISGDDINMYLFDVRDPRRQ